MLPTEHFPSFSRSSSGGPPVPVQDTLKNIHAEIDHPLIAMNGHSTRLSSGNPTSKEEMSSFQSAKDRFDRFNGRPSSGVQDNGSDAGIWHRSAGAGGINMDGPPDLSHRRIFHYIAGENSVPVSSVLPGPVWPAKNQLVVAYAYAIRRQDGTYTRLIRADELDDLNFKVPATEGPEGLIILPAPELVCPERRDSPEKYVTREFESSLPKNQAHRPDISTHTAVVIREDPMEKVQREIDSIVAKNPVSSPASPPSANKIPRRQKIYCDKWIHEGVCAFTQLGCKYKHEMPMDKATQLSLGLNHGLPAWYKRAHAVQIRPESQGSPSESRVAGSWRRPDGLSGHSTGLSLRSGISSSPSAASASGQPNFGPIGPPPPLVYHQPSVSNNPFSSLSQEDIKMDDDDEEDTITWPGRRR